MTIRQAAGAFLVTIFAATQSAGEPNPLQDDAYRTGLAFFQQKNYARAREVLLDALVDSNGGAPFDWRLAAKLHVLGVSEQALGRYTEARQHLEAALNQWPDTPYYSDPRATTLESLGNLLADIGDWDTAEPRFRSAIALKERAHGARSLEAAAVLNRVAERFILRGHLVDAKLLLEQALDIQRPALPPDDAGLLTTRIILAHTLRGLGHLEAARRHAADAEVGGRHSDLYPEILCVLGDVYRMEGNLTLAVPLLRRAIALAALRTSEQELPAAVISLAHIDLTEGRLLTAAKGFQRGITMIQQLCGAGRPEVASAQIGLATVMLESRRVEEASAYLNAAQPYIEGVFSDDPFFRTTGLVLRAALAAAREDRERTAEDVRLAWAAIGQETPGAAQAGLWAFCARVMKPYRPDLAKIADRRSRKRSREMAVAKH